MLALLAALAVAGCSTLTRIDGTELVYRRVTPGVAYYMLQDSPDALVLDLRPAGAAGGPLAELRRVRHLPLAELAGRAAELEPYRDRTFLVYCGADPECALAGMRTLIEHGCVYAVLIDGPLDGWAEPEAEPGEEPMAVRESEPEPAPPVGWHWLGIGR